MSPFLCKKIYIGTYIGPSERIDEYKYRLLFYISYIRKIVGTIFYFNNLQYIFKYSEKSNGSAQN